MHSYITPRSVFARLICLTSTAESEYLDLNVTMVERWWVFVYVSRASPFSLAELIITTTELIILRNIEAELSCVYTGQTDVIPVVINTAPIKNE